MLVLLKPLTKLFKVGAFCKRRFTVLFGPICEVSIEQYFSDIVIDPLWRVQGRDSGARRPLIFRPNWGPKGRKNFFRRPGHPLISESGSGTDPVKLRTLGNFSSKWQSEFENIKLCTMFWRTKTGNSITGYIKTLKIKSLRFVLKITKALPSFKCGLGYQKLRSSIKWAILRIVMDTVKTQKLNYA